MKKNIGAIPHGDIVTAVVPAGSPYPTISGVGIAVRRVLPMLVGLAVVTAAALPMSAQATQSAKARVAASPATVQGREYHLLLSAEHEYIEVHAAVLADLARSVETLNIREAKELLDEMSGSLDRARRHHLEIDSALAKAGTPAVRALHEKLLVRHDAIGKTLEQLRAALAVPPLSVDRPKVAQDGARIYWEAKEAEASNTEVRLKRGVGALKVPARVR